MPEAASSTRRYNRLTESQWAEAEALWQTGNVLLAELAERFNVATRTLQVRFQQRGVTKGSKAAQIAAEIRERVNADAFADLDDLTACAKQTREAGYRHAVRIEQALMAQVEIAVRDPASAFRTGSAIKALSAAAAAIERLHAVKREALGLDRHDVATELPQLIVRMLTDDEIEALQKDPDDDDLDDPVDDDEDDDIAVIS